MADKDILKEIDNPIDRMVVAAIRRGISTSVIADRLGVSRQAISVRARRYLDAQSSGRKRINKPSIQISKFINFPCARCGAPITGVAKAKRKKYCTVRCGGASRRVLNDGDILRAMEMRGQGFTWVSVEKHLGFPTQTIQAAIWRLLDDRRVLTERVLHPLWRPSPHLMRHTYSYQWLTERLGLKPTAFRTESTDG